MGQHFSKRRRKRGNANNVVPNIISSKEKIISELDKMNEHLKEIKNITPFYVENTVTTPTPSPV